MLFPSLLATSVVLVSSVPSALGYPGMEQKLATILARQDNGADEGDSNELFGDLLTLQDPQLTTVGSSIKQLLLGNDNPESTAVYTNIPALKSAACQQDTCCVWNYIVPDMVAGFKGPSGRCTSAARKAVRLGFHDAAGWNKATAAAGLPGGADGSIILNADELKDPENNGLQDFTKTVQGWYTKWHDTNGFKAVTMADMIQMSATVATVVCPLGPRVRSFVGRKDSNVKNPRLLPDVNAPADDLLQLFADKTIKAHGLAALVGAHTTSQQFFVNTARAGDPQDSTPGVWDVLFYGQTQGTAPTPKRVFKFPSDVVLAKHPKVQQEWQEFAGNGGQEHWNEDYAREYIRLSLLGVNNINNLTECSKVLPPAIKSYTPPDQLSLNLWLASSSQSALAKTISNLLNDGKSILGLLLTGLGLRR